MKSPLFNIAAVERETGLSKDVLRVWERRYGFPCPDRDENDERCYPAEQVERLRLIKRLMDQGHRPGKLVNASMQVLSELSPRRSAPSVQEAGQDAAALTELVNLIKQHDAAGYQQAMQQRLARQGLQQFVQDTVAPLAIQVGAYWEAGQFAIFEEHLFTELTKRLLRQAVAALPAGPRKPRILLATVLDEPHVLGLLMVETLLALEGAECIPMGAQMPVLEIARAAQAHQADVVALSFSVSFPARQIPGILQQLRQSLADELGLWVGGGGVARLTQMEGVRILHTLDASLQALRELQAQRGAS